MAFFTGALSGARAAWFRQQRILLVVLCLGFGLRLAISPTSGYDGDVRTFQAWAKSTVKVGVAGAYTHVVDDEMLPNYPPLSMLILAGTGHFYQTFFSPMYASKAIIYRSVIKLPAMLADVVIAALIYRLLRREGTPLPWLGAAVYLFHPASIYDSAVWGQVDSIYTAFLFGALTMFVEKRFATFGALLACAALTKAQTVVVLPLAAVLMLTVGRRHLVRATLAGLAVVAVVLVPFAVGGVLHEVKGAYTGAVGFYTAISSAAYNLWWALFGKKSFDQHSSDKLFQLITYRQLGWLLWGSSLAYSLAVVVRRYRATREVPTTLVFFAASIAAYSFFVVNTEMHERYLFPLVPLGIPVAFAWKRFRGPYAMATLLYFANLLGVLDWTRFDRALFRMFPTLTVLIATLQTACFVAVLRRYAEYSRSLATPTLVSGLGPAVVQSAPPPAPDSRRDATTDSADRALTPT